MGSFGRVEEDLDEYEDDFIDRDDEIGEEEYEEDVGEGGEEEEREDEPLSEEALKLLKYRQKLKEQERAKLRRESGGDSSNSRDQIRRPSITKFGSFFGPSKPVLADRVIQQSRALLETRHLAAKAPTSQSQSGFQSRSEGKNVSLPSTSRTVNGVSHQPSAKQVKSKLQQMKATRDYSWLYSEEDVPKSKSDPGPSGAPRNSSLKLDTRPAQVPAKANGSAHSGGEVLNGFQHRKEPGTRHINSARSVPPLKLTTGSGNGVLSSDSRRQAELRKQPGTSKHVASSSSGNRAVRPPNIVPPKKPLAATGQKAASGSLVKRPPMGSVSNKGPSPIQKHGQRPPLDKSRTSVGNSMERSRDVQQTTGNMRVKKENTLASRNQMKTPRESSHHGNLEREHARNHRPAGKLSMHSHPSTVRKEPVRPSNGVKRKPMSHSNGVREVPFTKKRRAENLESEEDALAELRKMLGPRPRYDDFSDDDSDMMEVADFDTIMKEESRSARIARQEDDEELQKIMEEERREALRKKAKMRMKSQR